MAVTVEFDFDQWVGLRQDKLLRWVKGVLKIPQDLRGGTERGEDDISARATNRSDDLSCLQQLAKPFGGAFSWYVKTIAGLLGLFYLNGRNTMRSQYVGKMIAKGIRHKQYAGLEVRPDPNGHDRIPMDGGQPDRPSRVNADSVGILLTHFNEAVGKKLLL